MTPVPSLRSKRSELPAAEAAELRRAVTATLRWRLRWLRGACPPRTLRAARLVAVALHASFERPGLRDDAPGVAGMRWRPSWSALARAFDLPPPCRAQRGAAQVEAVLALPAGELLELLVLVAPGLRKADVHAIAGRAHAAAALLGAPAPRLEIRVTDPVRLARDAEAAHRAIAFGALVSGRLSPGAWSALEATARATVPPAAIAALAAGAPTPLAGLALTLASGAPAPTPLAVATRLLRGGTPARLLADPSVLCARWAAQASPRHRDPLARAERLARPPGEGPAPAPDAGALLALGRELALGASRAIRLARREGVGPHARAAWREAIGPDLPRALHPAFAAQLGEGGLRTVLERSGAMHEVRLEDGAVLGRGATPVQARVRALSVLAAAAGGPLLEHAEPPWRAVLTRLAQPRAFPTLLLVVEPAGPSGPPFDPLNRGPERAIGFPGALAVVIAPGRRPSGRVLTGEQAVDKLVREALLGHAVEVVPARSEAHPVAARLAQIAGFVRGRGRDAPVALEAGGEVLLVEAGRLRRFPLGRFAARPRRFTPDPDAPDLALSPGERRPVGLGGPSVIECRAHLLDDLRAVVLYADARGAQLREIVFLADLEEHLRDARALLQAADRAAVLAVRLSEDLEPAVRRLGGAGTPVTVSVRGRLPHDLQVEVGGERHGGRSGSSWSAAARALLARWPKSGESRLAVSAVTISANGAPAGGLLALYARSVALRRLRVHLVRSLRTYQPRGSRRRTG